MTPEELNAAVITPTLSTLLPASFDTPEARVLMIAIGLQESGLTTRVQTGGPARGFWQFEKGGGVAGVLSHAQSEDLASWVCRRRKVTPSSAAVYGQLASDDILACAFARLLLWTDPGALPKLGDQDGAWDYYEGNWRPGKPRPKDWPNSYIRALSVVTAKAAA